MRLVMHIGPHKAGTALPLEDVSADNLARCYSSNDWPSNDWPNDDWPNNDWKAPGLDFIPALPARHPIAKGNPDPTANADRMSELFSALQTYFSANHRAA